MSLSASASLRSIRFQARGASEVSPKSCLSSHASGDAESEPFQVILQPGGGDKDSQRLIRLKTMALLGLLRRSNGAVGRNTLKAMLPTVLIISAASQRAKAARAVEELRQRRRMSLAGIPRVNLEDWNAGVCYSNTRFWPEEIIEIHKLLRFPQVVRVSNGCVESGLTLLAILLTYLATPTRHCDMSLVFGRERIVIGRIVRYSQRWVYENWCHLLKWYPRRLNPDRLEELVAALVENKSCPLDNCVGYIDGTVWRIARPQKNQRLFYNGHKRTHAIKYQAVTTPDGITGDLSRPFVGSRHDTCMFKASQIQEVLWRHAKGHNGRQMMLYGDKGYHPNDVIMTPFEGNEERMPRHRVRFNQLMTRCRIGVEHEFGRTRNLLHHTQYKDNLEFYKNELDEIYRVAVFFKNCLVCVGPGPGGAPLPALTLAEYLQS